MVDGSQHDIVTNECAIVNGDSALVLELAAHVDEHPLTNNGVLTTVSMKRREHPNRLRHLSSPQLFQQIMQLLWSMILAVNLSRYLQCLLRQPMKHHVDIAAADDRLS